MTTLLGRFTKQSTETLDYDVDFTDWFEGRTSTPVSFTVTAEAGITVVSSARSGNVVKVVLSGGTNGGKYKITVRLTTSDNLVKEADFTVRIKDV
jgi:hypothetical protein